MSACGAHKCEPSGIGRCNQGGILAVTTHPGQWRFLLSLWSFRGAAKRRARNPYAAANDMDSGLLAALGPGMTTVCSEHAPSFSRGKSPPSFAMFPRTNEGSGAPTGARVLARHPSRASDAGPQGEIARPRIPRRSACAVPRAGDARLSALHCGDFLAPGPPWRNRRALPRAAVSSGLALVHSHDPLVVADGRCCPDASRGRGYEPARRTPHPAPTLARLRRRPR